MTTKKIIPKKKWLVNQLLDIFKKYPHTSLTISALEKSILLSLAYFYPDIRPSHDMLANITGLNRRTIIRQISSLKTKLVLTVYRRFNGPQSRTNNRYVINIDALFKVKPKALKVTPIIGVTESHTNNQSYTTGDNNTSPGVVSPNQKEKREKRKIVIGSEEDSDRISSLDKMWEEMGIK